MDMDKKQNDNIRKLSILTSILFVIIILIVGWLFYDKIYTKKEENSKVKIEKTQTTSTKSGTYIVDVSDVVDNVMPCIVAITSKTKVTSGQYGPSFFGNNSSNSYSTGAGSGIIINKTDSELMILTNYHVIEDADELSVQFINNKSVDASVKGSYESRDIAVITVKLSKLDTDTINNIRIATLGDSNKLKVGQGIIAIGNALGYGQSVTTGVISALNREVELDDGTTREFIQTDAAINPGNSGGALLNLQGEVIGINSNKIGGETGEGMGYAIPISTAIPIINELIEREAVSSEDSAYLGLAGVDVSSEVAEMYNIPEGVYISQVVSGSAAESAGIERTPFC